MIHHEVEQNAVDWYFLRMAIPTSSTFDRIYTPGGKVSAQAKALMMHLLAEYVVAHPILIEGSKWMKRGQELEGEAVRAAEFHLGLETAPGGFFTLDSGLAGASPDRLIVGSNRTLEIKCPSEATHVRYMLHPEELQAEYKVQLQGTLWVSEKDELIICSYHPEFAPVAVHVAPDEQYIAGLSEAVNSFVEVMLERRKILDEKYGPFTPPKPLAADRELLIDGDMGITEDDLDEIMTAHKEGRWGKPREKRKTA